MSDTSKDFVLRLRDSGLIAESEASRLEAEVGEGPLPDDPAQLAEELVRRKVLTGFQAEVLASGDARRLVLGNYVILDRLGAGGMGEVYRAEHRRMHRVVALKVLPQAAVATPQAVARFQREMHAAAKLSHPNIVTAYDADESDGVHFLVMEYVVGQDLTSLVFERGPLPAASAVDLIVQTARGLEHAHGLGVIHRDIKPSNLLLDTAGTVKILDMGLARILDLAGDQATQEQLTSSGTVMGTVDFMSPEQAQKSAAADHRSDIYSLGGTLYFLLTGRPMYDGDSMVEKLLAHRERPIPELPAHAVGSHPGLETVFRRMVAKEPRDRYQTMSEVIAALSRWSGDGSGAASVTTAAAEPRWPAAAAPSSGSPSSHAPAGSHSQPSAAAPADEPRQATYVVNTRTGFDDSTLSDLEAGRALRREALAEFAQSRRSSGAMRFIAMASLLVIAAALAYLYHAGLLLPAGDAAGRLLVKLDQADALVLVVDARNVVQSAQESPGGAFSFVLSPGSYTVRVTKDGYESFSKYVKIRPDEVESLKVHLEIARPEPEKADGP